MDDLIALVLEVLVEGSMTGAESRKVPLAVRVVLATFLFVLLGGVGAFFLWFAWVSDVRLAVRLIALAVGLLMVYYLVKLARAFIRR